MTVQPLTAGGWSGWGHANDGPTADGQTQWEHEGNTGQTHAMEAGSMKATPIRHTQCRQGA